MEKTNQTLKLRDGRILGFAEYGDPGGKPVFHFNGSGGSRIEHPVDESVLREPAIRYISTDRPGHGLSAPQADRELLGWADDIAELADHLGIERFYLLGWSAGGPHALACAYKMPERIIAGALVSGLAPPDRPEPYKGYSGALLIIMKLGRSFPKLVYLFRRMAARSINKSSGNFGSKFVKSLPPEDRKPFEDERVTEMFLSDIKEGYRQGGDGPARDDIIINFPWGFDIRDISTKFHVWQGGKDKNVPLNQGIYQAGLLPDSHLHLLEDKGHMLLLDEWKRVLTELTEQGA